MKQATTRKNAQQDATASLQIAKRLREGGFILLCSLAIYLAIALVSYHQNDSAWSHSGMSNQIHNAAGKTGAWISDVLYSIFGYMAFLFPIVFIFSGILVYRSQPAQHTPHPLMWFVRSVGVVIALMASCGLTAMLTPSATHLLPMTAGGLLGVAIKSAMVGYLKPMGASVILSALFLAGITLFTGLSWLQLLTQAQKMIALLTLKGWRKASQIKLPAWEDMPESFSEIVVKKVKPEKLKSKLKLKLKAKQNDTLFADDFEDKDELPLIFEAPIVPIKKEPVREPKSLKPLKSTQPLSLARSPNTEYAIPDLALLEAPEKAQKLGYSTTQLQELSRLVESRLIEFGVEVRVVGVQPGPVITRFELDLAPGIKVSKISGLAKDLARSLSVVSVRVVEVIPGKSVVGLEIPNVHRELVRLKAVLEDPTYQQATSPLSMALGKDISGRPVTVDLAKMPHLLVAGTTGSGKSVGLNAMLLSILYKATAQEVRLILIDPKMLELAVYDNIPHLLTPVVTDMKDAANALRWCVAEMERRYQIMAAVGVRNLTGYNQKIVSAQKAGKPILDPLWLPQSQEKPQPLEPYPFIVVVVDEFADMMMVVGKKVEELIARIAQKARAAGIHLILATQRPSVDVITGLIKANIPTRIAFQVSSRIDSRTILDQSGAEQLLGHGDMLYLPPGVGVPHRIHGAFVSDEEVHKVTDELRRLGKPDYLENVVQSSVGSSAISSNEEVDELYDQALAIVTQSRKASISLIQRRLKIGYNRAARLIEQMEAEGVVSAMQSNGAREVIAPPPVDDF